MFFQLIAPALCAAGKSEGLGARGSPEYYRDLQDKIAEREQMWHDIGAICASGWTRDNEARSPNEWAEALLHDRDELRKQQADAIPREIHERLVRDAKREVLRDLLPQIADVQAAEVIRRVASKHERGE
jgi:hypothetical protein